MTNKYYLKNSKIYYILDIENPDQLFQCKTLIECSDYLRGYSINYTIKAIRDYCNTASLLRSRFYITKNNSKENINFLLTKPKNNQKGETKSKKVVLETPKHKRVDPRCVVIPLQLNDDCRKNYKRYAESKGLKVLE